MSAEYPFQNSTSKIVVLHDAIDVEEQSRLYDLICEDAEFSAKPPRPSPSSPPSILSRDSIWLSNQPEDGSSPGFAQDVSISGWTHVGDRLGSGAYVAYDCVIKSKEGPVIHAHKRYSAFETLHDTLRRTLPFHQRPYIPTLPPKYPLAKFRPAFLDRRRRKLEHWLSAVLLHPDIGASQAVKEWVMD